MVYGPTLPGPTLPGSFNQYLKKNTLIWRAICEKKDIMLVKEKQV